MEKITYGYYNSVIGEMVLGKTCDGICWLGFMVEGYKGNGYERMYRHFKGAEFMHYDDAVKDLGDDVIKAWERGGTWQLHLTYVI